jgi:transposase
MPKLLHALAPRDVAEEQKVRKLANSPHAPGDWIMRARMIVRSWDGLRTKAIAEELGCHPQSVRERFHRFNAQGIDGLGDLPGAGRKPRITEAERSRIIALVATDPPGRLVRGAGGELEAINEEKEAHWTLDALSGAARQRGITVGRSQLRRILKAEGVRWRNPHPWGESDYLRSLPQKDEGPHALHRPPSELDDHLPRGVGRSEPAHLPTCSRLVAGGAPHQGTSGVQPRSRKGLGLRCCFADM